MKMYLVERTDEAYWDEYRAFVVRAKDEESALNLCIKKANEYEEGIFKLSNTKVTEIPTKGKEEIIIEDFREG